MKKAADEADLAVYILGYLLDNPNAEDTIDGIVEWWVMQQRIKHETARVRTALRELIDKGFVLERIGAASKTRYRVNPVKLRAIRAYLKGTSRKEKG